MGLFPETGAATKFAVGPVFGAVGESFLHPAGTRRARTRKRRSASGARRSSIGPSILPYPRPEMAANLRLCPGRGAARRSLGHRDVALDLLAQHRQRDRPVPEHGVMEGLDVEPGAELLLRLVPEAQD